MKTLKNVMMALVCILFLSSATYAQFPPELLNWSIGARFGTYFSHTDTKGGMGFAAEGNLERKFGDRISLQGTMLFGTTAGGSGDEITLKNPSATATKASYAFSSSVFEMVLHGKYYIQRETISPFASLGGGMLFYNTEIDIKGDDSFGPATGWNSVPTADNKESSVYRDGVPIGTWVVPVGIGFNYAINDLFDLSASYTFRFTGTDNLDAISASSGGAEKIAGVVTPGSTNNYSQAAHKDLYNAIQFKEVAADRQTKAGTGDDMLSLFVVGVSYKFFNPGGEEEKKEKEKKEDE